MLADYADELGDALGPVFDDGGRLLTVGYFGDGDGSRPTRPPEGSAGPDGSGFVATVMFTGGDYFADHAAALTPTCSDLLGDAFCCNPAPDELTAVELFAIAEDDSSCQVAFPDADRIEVEIDLTARTPDGSQTLGIEGTWTADACAIAIPLADKPYVPFEPFENVGL